jgi:hypothetical protein
MKSRRFEKSEIDSIGLSSGVYIIFEEGEAAHGGNRVVRVGTNTGEDAALSDRLYEHYKNEGRNIFRKHIARCLLEKEPDTGNLKKLFHSSKYLTLVRIWKKNASEEELKKFYEIHDAINAHIRKYCSFVVLLVCMESCRHWEKKIIFAVAAYPDCGLSPKWLGNMFPENIRLSYARTHKSGLWNVDHVNNNHILTDIEITGLETIIELSRGKPL